MKPQHSPRTWTAIALLMVGLSLMSANTRSSLPVDAWEKLGEHRVTLETQSDEFHFPPNSPVLTAIKIKSRKGAINLQRCMIQFANGEKKTIELRNDIPPGGESRTINLPGNKQPMTKFVFWYGASQSGAEKAEIEIWGKV